MMLMLNVPAHDRADRAGPPDRGAAVRARHVHAGRHGGHGGGADVLRARAARLLGGQDRLAHVLLAARQPHAGAVSVTSVARQPRAQPRAGARHGLPRASRSARRSRRCSTPAALLWLLGRRLGRPRAARGSPSPSRRSASRRSSWAVAALRRAAMASALAAGARRLAVRALRVFAARSATGVAVLVGLRARSCASLNSTRRCDRRRAPAAPRAEHRVNLSAQPAQRLAPPDHPADGRAPTHGGRLREHLRAAAAAAHPAARPLARRGRHADDAASRWRRRWRRSASATSRTAGGRACSSWPGPSSRCRSSASSACRHDAAMLAAILVAGGLGARGVPSAGRGARPPARRRSARASRCRCTSRAASLGFSLGPLLFAPFVAALRARVDAAARAARAWWSSRSSCTRVPPMPHPRIVARRASRAATVREAADAALRHRRAAHAHVAGLRDVRAGAC